MSSILRWPLEPTILVIGAVVVLYTVSGGTRAVSLTQRHQMMVIMTGMAAAAVIVIMRLPPTVSLGDALHVAGALGRVNVVSFKLDWSTRYNFWSGLGGGFFLAMSYFGTDQSQVGRYLSGRSVVESRLGLVFNGIFKVPMQFFILFIGLMVFVFYLFTQPPLFFNGATLDRVAAGPHAAELDGLERRYDDAFAAQRAAAERFVAARADGPAAEGEARAQLRAAVNTTDAVRAEAKSLVKRALPRAETKDADYIFLTFVMRYVPRGLLGLLIAVILAAAMSSVAGELSALGSTTTIDLYKRLFDRPERAANARRDLWLSKTFTVLWGVLVVAFASFASLLDNLIQAVNIVGSLFYGTLLGMFVVGFFLKRVSATPVLIAALVAQGVVATLFFASSLGFLWYNVIGTMIVVGLSVALEEARRAWA
jgi:Na+/proline symporter